MMSRKGVFGVALAFEAVLVLLVAPVSSVGAGGGAFWAYALVGLVPGRTTTVPETLHLVPLPPKADVVLAFDTTGSMGAAITDAKSDAANIVTGIRSSIPNARVGVVDFHDYPLSPYGTPPSSTFNIAPTCSTSGCTAFNTSVSTLGDPSASFLSNTPCGPLTLDFYLDGAATAKASTPVAPGATANVTLGPVTNGTHSISIHATPSCDGAPSSWPGTLTLTGSGDFPYRVVQPLDP